MGTPPIAMSSFVKWRSQWDPLSGCPYKLRSNRITGFLYNGTPLLSNHSLGQTSLGKRTQVSTKLSSQLCRYAFTASADDSLWPLRSPKQWWRLQQQWMLVMRWESDTWPHGRLQFELRHLGNTLCLSSVCMLVPTLHVSQSKLPKDLQGESSHCCQWHASWHWLPHPQNSNPKLPC